MPDQESPLQPQQVLADFGAFVLHAKSLDVILTEAAIIIARTLAITHSAIVERRVDEPGLRLRAGHGWAPDLIGRLMPEAGDQSPEAEALRTRKPVLWQEGMAEGLAQQSFMREVEIRTLAAVPILLPGERFFGLLQAAATLTPRQFTPPEIDFLRSCANILGLAVDRFQKLDQLRSSAEQFRLIVEHARDYAIFVTDAQNRVTDWLPGAEAVFGWRKAEILGRSGSILYVPEDVAAKEDEKEVVTARTKGVAPDRRWHLRKDGSRVFIDGTVTSLHGDSGELRGFLKIGQDITERRHVEEQLRESEERLRALVNASSYMIYRMSPDWMELRAFEGRGILSDKPSQDGTWLTAYIYFEDRKRVWNAVQEAIRTKSVFELEHRFVRTDGSIGWTLSRAVPILETNGEIREWFGAASDITPRRRTEEALRESEARQRVLIEGMPQLAWRAIESGKWNWSSPQWSAYTGLLDESSLDLGWLDAVHPEDRESAISAWQRAEAEDQFQADYRIFHAPSGQYRWCQSRSLPIRDDRGGVIEWIGTSTDIDDQIRARQLLERGSAELEERVAARTAELERALEDLRREIREREQAEVRLRQSEKLKAIGQLTGGIAHDFNNMLQGVISSLSMIRSRLTQQRVTEIPRYIEAGEKAAKRSAALVQHLLAFSRQQTLQPEPICLDTIALDMQDLIERTVGPAVEVELQLSDGQWLVRCDRSQLESALLNLCVNARDAMPDGGWLTITTEDIILNETDTANYEDAAPGRYATIAVSDTGTGMTPEILAHVFEPFFTTKPIGEGTGLGLSQIYGFMRQSGGLVQIDTTPGKGTTVRLCLPFHAMNPDVRAGPVAKLDKTVLLVEDEIGVRELTAEELRDSGYRVLEADRASNALRLLRAGLHVDLLITDYGLPGDMNGWQMVELARERYPGLPVIMITGYASGLQMTEVEVIHKPFDPKALLEQVRSLVGGKPPYET
ncbi:PAS domain S-box protein [Dongia soli]|uniref:histidine kinase n=1 Tax=Dongia soli TaxID=600628 RepID=A0ABU5EFC2_9PROT|nr:PAS domain S-box protein [Dongia soli]MDY0884719.1 PAS domain S-box protein [Dongia soli]